ncbi:hypothetical protein OXPF_26340 [Oxobacter pfennigii]|uniref:Uncharacterized protein n=1 Tax=Oxobacter pfennigii TaxID=36849 RepID=A0A0P8WMP2_9CLOT|nr:hypothetical protein OXPF_26340 [Oxobacter pfennigii]
MYKKTKDSVLGIISEVLYVFALIALSIIAALLVDIGGF